MLVGARKWLFAAVAFTEFIHLTGGIHNFLLASEKWVALRTNINTHRLVTVGRTRCEGVATAATYTYILVLWMNFRFHGISLVFRFSNKNWRIIRNPQGQLKYLYLSPIMNVVFMPLFHKISNE